MERKGWALVEWILQGILPHHYMFCILDLLNIFYHLSSRRNTKVKILKLDVATSLGKKKKVLILTFMRHTLYPCLMWKEVNSVSLKPLGLSLHLYPVVLKNRHLGRVLKAVSPGALIYVFHFSLQVGERCSLGWSPTCSLPGWFCHCLWLLVQLPEQDTTGEVSWSDCQCLRIYVWNFIQERMGISIPAQSSAHQLHGFAHRKPSSDESRCVRSHYGQGDAWHDISHCCHVVSKAFL